MKPCSTCPFLRSGKPGELGGSPPETYVGQIRGEFWLPCHSCVDYSDPNWKAQLDTPQCVGAAIFRANVNQDSRYAKILKAPKNHALVFSDYVELLAHHKQITIERAADELAITTPDDHAAREYRTATIHIVPKP